MYFLRLLLWTVLSLQIIGANQAPVRKASTFSDACARSPATTTGHRQGSPFQEAYDSSSLIFRRSPVLSDADRALVLEFGGRQLRKEQSAARMKLLETSRRNAKTGHPFGLPRYVQSLSPIPNSPYELDANEPLPDAKKACLDAEKTYLDVRKAAFQARKVYLDAKGALPFKYYLHELSGFRQARRAYDNSLKEYSKNSRAYWDNLKASRVVPFTGRHFLKGSISKTTASINASPDEREAEAKWKKHSQALLNVASVNRDMRQRMARLHETDTHPLHDLKVGGRHSRGSATREMNGL